MMMTSVGGSSSSIKTGRVSDEPTSNSLADFLYGATLPMNHSIMLPMTFAYNSGWHSKGVLVRVLTLCSWIGGSTGIFFTPIVCCFLLLVVAVATLLWGIGPLCSSTSLGGVWFVPPCESITWAGGPTLFHRPPKMKIRSIRRAPLNPTALTSLFSRGLDLEDL